MRELFDRDGYAPFEEDDYRALMFCTECAIGRAIGLPWTAEA